MYIDKLHLKNIRTFVDDAMEFVHPETACKDPEASDEANAGRLPKPGLPNVNLLLGENGAGKTTVLQAIALASLGPAAPIAQLPLPRFVRFDVNNSESPEFGGHMTAEFRLHEQGIEATGARQIHLELTRHSELEELHLGYYNPACLSGEDTATIIARSQKGEPLSDGSRDIMAFLVNEVNQIGSSTNESLMSSLRRDFAKFVLQREFEKRGLPETWERVYDSKNPAFFCVAYGATRRIDPGD
ncbi:MAG: AAA family ATPase, partial [Planctomycetaceae bacterium]